MKGKRETKMQVCAADEHVSIVLNRLGLSAEMANQMEADYEIQMETEIQLCTNRYHYVTTWHGRQRVHGIDVLSTVMRTYVNHGKILKASRNLPVYCEMIDNIRGQKSKHIIKFVYLPKSI